MFFNDPNDPVEKREYKRVAATAAQIVDEYEGSLTHRNISRDLGICSDCDHLEFAESRWNKCFAKCGYFDLKLNLSDPIEKCNKHKPVGSMDINDMWNIYTPIENKQKVGF